MPLICIGTTVLLGYKISIKLHSITNYKMHKELLFFCIIIWGIGFVYHILAISRINQKSPKNDCFQFISNNSLANISNFVHNTPATTGNLFKMDERIRTFKSDYNAIYKPFVSDLHPFKEKWAVVTTIFSPTKLVKTLSTMNDWCTVIVADLKSLSRESYMEKLAAKSTSCIVYLTVQDQAALGYAILDYIQFNSFGRKNIGYIFAIQHGAQTIYDTDDDNEISDQLLMEYWSMNEWNLGPNTIFEWVTVGSNPYPVYGIDNVWPRGIPLNHIKDAESFSSTPTTTETKKRDICVVQTLANEEPDVDAIYRLTSPKYPMTFRSDKLFASQIRTGQMAPFNAQATLFFKEAFPVMLLPVTVHGRVSDIWRSYIAQAVMKCSLVFSSPWVTQIRNSHNYLADFEAELPLYLQSDAFVDFLTRKNKYSELKDAFVDAYEYGIIEKNDVELALAWQDDMKRAEHAAKLPRSVNILSIGAYVKPFRHLLIAMGRGEHLKQWKYEILNSDKLNHVDAVLGVFDEPVEALGCEGISRFKCVSVKDTSWATGRNKLAKTAYNMEVGNNQYTYWTFVDSDIVLRCLIDGNMQAGSDCFVNYDLILQQSMWPIVTLIAEGGFEILKDSFLVKLESFDGAWNSFHRDAVPVLLPYQSGLDFVTWWSSQAIFWYKVRCFSNQFAIAPLSIFYSNPEHNPYPRNARNAMEEISIGQKTLGKLAVQLGLAPMDYPEQFTKEKIRSLHEIQGLKWKEDLDSYKLCARELTSGFNDFIMN